DSDDAAELEILREKGSHRGWWNSYSAIFGDDLLRFFGYEHGAETIRTYDGALIPGLLQTEDYARAVIRGAGPNIRLAEVEKRVKVRMMRQGLLIGEEPLHLTAVINEAALRQRVGGKEVLVRQLNALVEKIDDHHYNLDVRVIPFEADCYHALG